MLEVFNGKLEVTSQMMELLSKNYESRSKEELVRLRILCIDLIHAISARQNDLPWFIESLRHPTLSAGWDTLIFLLNGLAEEIPRMLKRFKREKGDFVVDATSTYRSIVLGQ